MEEMKTKNSKIKKFFVFMFMLAIATVVCGVAYVIATKEYDLTAEEILTQESSTVSTWTQNTVASINLWTNGLDTNAKRVSSSELYRLFAKEASSLTNEEAVRLNNEELSATQSLSEQVPYMRNILNDFMSFNGYADARLLDNEGIMILSAEARPTPINDIQVEVGRRAVQNNALSFSPVVPYQNGLILHFADPLNPVFSQSDDNTPIGTLLLSTPVTSAIARFLTYDNQGEEKVTPYIVQKNGGFFEVVDVQGLNFKLVDDSYQFAEEKLDFALRQSVNNPEQMVWSSGTFVPNLNWWIIVEIPSALIQNKLDSAAAGIYGFAFTFSIGFILVLALLWWIAVGREQKANAKRFESLYTLIDEQKRILDNVNAALDTGLLAADITGKVIMANRAFTELCVCKESEIVGENFAPIFDPAFTHELLSGIAKVSQTGKPLTAEYSAMLSKETRLLRLTFYPFLDNEIEEAEEGEITPQAEKNAKKTARKFNNAALITFTDITEFRRQSEAKKHVQEKSMQALVRAVESMDPYLTGHSRRMEQLGVLICKTLQLGDNDLSTVAIAANLSQIGKLFVSRDLLLKQGSLTPEDKAQLLSIPEKAWLTLKEIDFHLPVPEAVHDMYERLDGKGYPRKLEPDAINIHARVLGVVNTFCAMTAPRSYRRGATIDDALEHLRNDRGFDQNVVSALDAVLRTPEGLKVARASTGVQ